jgi:hypothetical protein
MSNENDKAQQDEQDKAKKADADKVKKTIKPFIQIGIPLTKAINQGEDTKKKNGND